MRTETHPARSPEFLSRLHDGDLTAAERAHFESHRAHCGECRRAAAEFEAALSLFRSSQTSPAEPDLASRILRRLQSASPRRRPFGIFYGIDLRWAGAFAAALVAMIIGSAVVMRQTPPGVQAGPTPIPVTLETNQSQE
ncbi:MAG: anti-sigma factor, partial [Thermoanaerobaculia bacterium]